MGELADRIRARRIELGLTQAELGERVGRAPSTIGSWEAGRTEPSDSDVLETLTHVLDLDAIEAGDPDSPVVPPEESLEEPEPPADTGGEPNDPPPTSEGGIAPREETPMERTDSTTTVVVARSRRVAQRLVERLGRPATVATVEPVRTDVDPMYRIRAAATAAVVVALGAVFLWAIGHLADELGAIFDAFLAPWR